MMGGIRAWWRQEVADFHRMGEGIAEVRALRLNPIGLRCQHCGRPWPGTTFRTETGWLVAILSLLLWFVT